MNRILDRGNAYESYRNLPTLAGIGAISDAMAPGFPVESCVGRLKRYHYALKRLHQILTSRIPAEPIYELKMGFSHHSYLCAEHVGAFRKRVGEMREPPLGLDRIPHPSLERFFDEIRSAPTTGELLIGVYQVAMPALIAGLEQHVALTNPLSDYPSCRVCRFALLELKDMEDYGRRAIACLEDDNGAASPGAWMKLLANLLNHAGGISGDEAVTITADADLAPCYSGRPYTFDSVVRRDERFHDPYNMGVNAEAYLYNDDFDDASKVVMMFYKRLREIDVPEVMAGIITETPGKPWEYYHEMSRQLWDEARHAMMGEVGFISLGLDWTSVPINFTWSMALNTQLTPEERHAVLYFIEQGLMSRTGKRHEWEVGVASEHPLAALFQDYDWADEVLHAHIGRRWYVSEMASPKEAVDYGDQCWTKVFLDWDSWREQGLTGHRNWWPRIYRIACEKAGLVPKPHQLAFDVSYATQRADLKTLPAE